VMPRSLLIALAMLAGVHSAYAHGIAGNRFFPGTLSFDDPAVADEAILPNLASFESPVAETLTEKNPCLEQVGFIGADTLSP
jgi:hypothetical protein